MDLYVLDRVFEVAWEQVKARDIFRDQSQDGERKQALRKMIVTLAQPGRVDFDKLCDLVLANIPEPRNTKPPAKKRRQSPPGIGA
jgi:hypothetical protein